MKTRAHPSLPVHVLRTSALLCFGVLLAACVGPVTPPPDVRMCARVPFGFPLTDDVQPTAVDGMLMLGPSIDAAPQNPFQQSLLESLRSVESRQAQQVNILALSGGGQWGAFGTGFLNGWSAADSPVNGIRRGDIQIVTGISTGALQSTMAFIGPDTPVPSQTGVGQVTADERLAQSYLGTGPVNGEGVRENPINDAAIFNKKFGDLQTFFSNASGDTTEGLDVLVARMTNDMIDHVGATAGNRKLYVGVVNLHDSKFWVFDMKEIAAAGREDCYAEVVLASAAVPGTFAPRFLDGIPFVDGGARFGVFVREADLAVQTYLEEAGRAGIEKNIFVIVNGDLGNEEEVVKGYPNPNQLKTFGNSTLGIAKRTVDAITDQIYKDSVYRIEMDAKFRSAGEPWKTHYVYVDRDECHVYKRQDQENSKFAPRFMKCLYDLGYEKGVRQQWITDFDLLPEALPE